MAKCHVGGIMNDVLGATIAVTIAIGMLSLGIAVGGDVVEGRIKSNKLIIIDNSSYRCKMVKTLDEE